jgi:hypothetical protein
VAAEAEEWEGTERGSEWNKETKSAKGLRDEFAGAAGGSCEVS